MTQKTNRLHFSTRTVAMVLSIVMLIGSIATGSMLSTFAAYLNDAAAKSDAVTQAATEGGDIALNAIPSEDNAAQQDDEAAKAEALSDFEENEIVRGMKEDLADTGANADLAGTGATLRYIYCGISDHYDSSKDGSNFGFNFWGGTSGGVKSGTWIENYTHDGRQYHMFRVQVYDDNNKAQFKGNANWYVPDGGESVTLNGTTKNAVFWSHQNDGWSGQFQENYQVTSEASLSATRTNMTTAQSSTLAPSLTSNATYNTIKSTSYSVTTNPNSGGSVTSDGVFTATKAGTYTVTATVTYNAKGFSGITKTATATKQITVTSATTPLTTPQISFDKTYISTNGTEVTVHFNNWSSFSNAATTNLYTLKLYKEGSSTALKTITANDTKVTLNSAGNYVVKCEPTTAGSASFTASTSNKVNVKEAPAFDFQLIGDVGADCIATVNDTTNTGTGAWPGGTGWDTANRLNVNGATATPGVYQIKVKTAQTDKTINIGLYQMSANLQRGYKLGDTYYNTVGADYEVPNSGVADSDNLYIVTGTGSIILAPDTEYTITIDQTQTLNASNPFGKITITTNKADINAIARVKKFDISTGQPSDEITNAPAYIGTAVADPSTGIKGFTTTLTATAGAGYHFDGWYTDENCTGEKDGNPVKIISALNSTKYYALFIENEPAKYTYSVTTDGHGTASSYGGTGVDTANNEVYKGGTLTFNVTPASGYILDKITTDSGVATHNGNKVTVSGFNDNITVNVTFKQIETWALTLKSSNTTYGKISSVTYYNANGQKTTTSNPTNNSAINVQKDTEVSLTAAPSSSSYNFTGWTLEDGKYQRSSSTPLSAKTIKIKPSANQTITAGFIKLPSLSANIGIYFDDGAIKGTNQKLYADTTGSHNGKTNICWYTFTLSKGTHKFHFYDENHKYGHHSSKPNLDPSKEEWVVSYQYEKDNNYNTPYEVTISEDGDYTFYLQPTWHKDGDYGYYDVDMVKGTHSSGGSDDTPSTTGYKDLYVLDGIVTRYNDAIQDYGTNKFGNSIIVSAKSGVLKYNYYDAVNDELFVRKGDGHDEGHTVYYYDDKSDLDFRVQTTITANHKNIGVRAYVMNGMTYPAKKSKDGVYYADITLDSHSEQGTLEVVPVYYNTLIPEKDYIKFYVDANSIGNNWGKTIGYSIWYQDTALHGMEGGYPGQPLLSDGNLLYGYFPKYYVGVNDDTLPTVDNRSKFAGVLLTNLAEHNLTHQDVLKAWGVTNNTNNYQTFDYEDPAKIAEIENVDTIEFIAKYQETNANHQTGTHFVSNYGKNNGLISGTSYTTWQNITKPTATNLNGFEVLTDIDGNPVDIYNNKIEGGANFNNAVYVVSVGNQIVSPNQWDTVWMVYTGESSPTFITAKNPAEFINVAEGSQSDALKGKTVYINYEKFLDGNAKSGISNSGDRIDGRWVYSRSSDDTTLRLRVATKDGSGNLTFKNDFLDWSEISDGYHTGVKESRPSGVTNDNWLLNLDDRTTEVTAKINPVGYKVEGFYMLGARYAGAGDNGFSSKLSDYDDMNAEGTATSFINARDNRMVIVVSEIPDTDLLITHQMYGGPGSHKIKGFYYLKAELLDSNNNVKATYNNNSTAADGTTNKDIAISHFTTDAPKGQGYKLKITIKTAMSGSATFYQWYENDHNNGYNLIDSDAARGSADPVEQTITVNVDSLYRTEGQYLAIKNLDYYSDLQAADSININHLLIGDIQDGQAYNKVTVTDSTGKAIKGGEYSERNRTTVVDSSFITEENAEAGYQIKVEIWTVPGTNASFEKFYHTDKSDMQTGSYEGIAYTIGEKVIYQNVEYEKATAMVPISYFFKDAPSDDGEGVVKVFDATKKDFNLYSSLNDLSGELIITHQLFDNGKGGTAKTYITVDLCDTNNQVIDTIVEKTDTTNTTKHDVTVGKEYIKPDSDKKLLVTLTTELGDWTDFIQFDRMVGDVKTKLEAMTNEELTATVQFDLSDLVQKKATILFRIANLYNTNKEQIMDQMDFYSEIEQPTFHYNITYKYDAYVSSYGEQSYNITGDIDPEDLPKYMKYDHSALRFINDSDKKTYVSAKAPLEDNFMKTISYTNFITEEEGYLSSTHTVKVVVKPTTVEQEVNVKLELPYAHDNKTYEPLATSITDDKVTESQPLEENRTVKCKGWLVGSGTQSQDGGDQSNLNFIKAPLLLYSSSAKDKTKHFLYWEVKTQSKFGSTEKTYTRCYDYEFNLAIFQDCVVTPIYAEGGFDAEKMPNPPTTWNMYERFDPYVMRNADKDGAGDINITFMENSRNQYNHNGCGDMSKVPTARQGAADRIYSDFLLSYNNIEGIEKLYEHPEEYKCGIIIEAAGDLDTDSSGKYIINTEAAYKTQYQSSEKDQAVTDLILSNDKSADGRMKSEFDCSALDNKNRTRYYVGLNNRAAAKYNASNPPEIGENYLSTTTRVLRAYAYIYKVGANGAKEDIKISDPAYFTIYNIATVQDGGTYSENN